MTEIGKIKGTEIGKTEEERKGDRRGGKKIEGLWKAVEEDKRKETKEEERKRNRKGRIKAE